MVGVLKVITEAVLREELKNIRPETYYIPNGKILSPAGREYLQQLKIKISEGERPEPPGGQISPCQQARAGDAACAETRFLDYESGAYFTQKPEHMTHLYANVLVNKNHPRIIFRGKLDTLQALIVMTQCQILAETGAEDLVRGLQEILDDLREIMRCDVLEEPLNSRLILGLDHAQLRERSHNPMKFYNVKQMTLPHYTMGRVYALLNQVRTSVRETELAAVSGFKEGARLTRRDIVEEFNRLSSAVHILMCMYLAGKFK